MRLPQQQRGSNQRDYRTGGFQFNLSGQLIVYFAERGQVLTRKATHESGIWGKSNTCAKVRLCPALPHAT